MNLLCLPTPKFLPIRPDNRRPQRGQLKSVRIAIFPASGLAHREDLATFVAETSNYHEYEKDSYTKCETTPHGRMLRLFETSRD